jgi:murein DD-endopeptidase MepM/ murein hydrolase activator NlpD
LEFCGTFWACSNRGSIWPVAGWLSSAYGSRRDPFTGAPDFHAGLDIAADRGEAVKATANGTVESAGYSGSYGNLVVLSHGFGMTTRYGHLARMTVRPGQQIRRGDIIGYVGSTGRSTSSHLHYEVWWNNRLINPLRLLSSRR